MTDDALKEPHLTFDTKFSDWLDNRIDRNTTPLIAEAVNKIKLWIFGGLAAVCVSNMVPVAIFIYQFGQFKGTVEERLEDDLYTQSEHSSYAIEVDRRFDEIDNRISRAHPREN